MKITKLFLLGLAVIFFSCGEDEDPKPTSKGMIGAWAVTAIDYKGTTTTTGQGVSIEADFTGTGKDMDLTITFNENPNTVTSEGSYIIVLETTVLGQTTTEEYPFDEIFIDGTWTLDGSTLTITDPSGSDKATITEQTSTTLKMRMVVIETTTDQGITVASNVQITYVLEKN